MTPDKSAGSSLSAWRPPFFPFPPLTNYVLQRRRGRLREITATCRFWRENEDAPGHTPSPMPHFRGREKNSNFSCQRLHPFSRPSPGQGVCERAACFERGGEEGVLACLCTCKHVRLFAHAKWRQGERKRETKAAKKGREHRVLEFRLPNIC